MEKKKSQKRPDLREMKNSAEAINNRKTLAPRILEPSASEIWFPAVHVMAIWLTNFKGLGTFKQLTFEVCK